MTLAKTVTMTFPSKNHGGIRLLLTDDERLDIGPGQQIVIDENIIENYSGDITPAVIASLTKSAQKKIDEYRELVANNDVASYQAAKTTIDEQLDTTKVMAVKK